MVVTRVWGEGEMENCHLMDIEFQFCKMKKFRRLLHDNVNILNTTELDTSKWLGW